MSDKEPLGAQGATKERMSKSDMSTDIAVISKGGIPLKLRHRDKEHCTLDWLLNQDIIEKDMYDAGMQLRGLWFEFNTSGVSCCEERTSGYEGFEETPADKARVTYYRARDAIHPQRRTFVAEICTGDMIKFKEGWETYGLSGMVCNGLVDLLKHFTCGTKQKMV